MKPSISNNLISALNNLSCKEILFNKRELNILNQNRKVIPKNIIYCSFENQFAKSGGLSAVVKNILPYLEIVAKKKYKSSRVLLLTPFHSKQKSFQSDNLNSLIYVSSLDIPYLDSEIKINIYKYESNYSLNSENRGCITEYYLKADGFFESQNSLGDPYIYDLTDPSENNFRIIQDSIFFCKAVPFVVNHLGFYKDIIFHLQEWQTSFVSITSKLAMFKGKLGKNKLLKSCLSMQTMHNTFDSYESPGLFLEQFMRIANYNIRDNLYLLAFKHIIENNFSSYSLSLPFTDCKITTVSKNFAKEITSDIIQTKYFVPHIQSIIKSKGKVKGINNGMFNKINDEFEFVFDNSVTNSEKIERLKKLKLVYRAKLLGILSAYMSEKSFGSLSFESSDISNLPDDIPIFIMSGRLDQSQKGYDILLKVIDELHSEQLVNGFEIAKFVLTPLPTKEKDLDFLREIANKCRGNILVIPERMKEGYETLQLGSTFGLMPSIFEPFGAAIEYMVNGTLVIARSTGGLKDQISDDENGLLYHEKARNKNDRDVYTIENIKDYYKYRNDIKIPLLFNKWAIAMTAALKGRIKDAVNLYKDSDEYYKLILNGFKKAVEFNWTKTAKEYYKYYRAD